MDADSPASQRSPSSTEKFRHVLSRPLHLLSGLFAYTSSYVRNLNFIKLHYFYIALLSIVGSIALYTNQNIRYIDALFFSMGACTQGGLNPIDVNLLSSWQQAVLYMLPHVSSPIVVNAVVVFVRLYYFEKEFHGIRKRSKLQSKYRRSLSHSSTIYRGENPRQSILQRILAPFFLSVGRSKMPNNSESPANPLSLAPTGLSRDTMRNTLSNMNANARFSVADVDLENGNRLHHTGSVGQLPAASHAAPPPLASRAITFNDPSRPPKTSPDLAADSLRRACPSLENARPYSTRDSRTGNLPHPSHGNNNSKRQKAVLPSDIAHSISLLESRFRSAPRDDDKGPALVIHRPQDLEEEEQQQHYHRHKDRARHTHLKRDNLLSLLKTSKDERGEGTKALDPVTEPSSKLIEHRRTISFGEMHNYSSPSAYAADKDTEMPMPARTRAVSLDEYVRAKQQEKHSFDFPHLTKASQGNSSPLSPWSNFDAMADEHEIYSDGSDPKDGGDALSKHGEASSGANDSTVPPYFFNAPTRTMTDSDAPSLNLRRVMSANYVSWQPAVEGNSVFVNMTDDQKEELGGVEYRALKLLAKILVMYYVGWNIVGLAVLTAWGVRAEMYREMFRQTSVARGWWGVFTAGSAFCNVGFTLTPNSMASFSTSICVLLFVPFLMIIGNTGFPVFLRFTIWIMFKLTDPYGRMHESLGFLLDHPRRCFTLLFPSGPTWWLLGVLVALNLTDTVLFLILDLNNAVVTVLPVVYRILAGFFQAVSTRMTGFAVLNIGALHPAILVSYTIMMYISVFPIAMSVRHTNVYEEQTLGMYRAPPEKKRAKSMSDLSTHLMRQVSYDLWFLFISLFIVCICEEGKIVSESNSIPIFNILFELTSAYGAVGLSMGYPGVNISLSGEFSTVGKMVVIVLLYCGRHRSLPYAIDRAIMLPSKKMQENDLVQELMVARRPSHFTTPALLSRAGSTLSVHVSYPRARTPHPHVRRAAQSIYSFSSSSDSFSSGRSRGSDADDEGEGEEDSYEYARRRGGPGSMYFESRYSDEQPVVA